MPSLPPVNKAACECFMGLCLKINEVRRFRGSCLAREVGIHIFPREQRVREGRAREYVHICKILHTSVSTVSSSGPPGWECVTFLIAVVTIPGKQFKEGRDYLTVKIQSVMMTSGGSGSYHVASAVRKHKECCCSAAFLPFIHLGVKPEGRVFRLS